MQKFKEEEGRSGETQQVQHGWEKDLVDIETKSHE